MRPLVTQPQYFGRKVCPMSSEIPTNERDTELRQMLVATASAAPIRPRRSWRTAAPIAAFALAGALSGTVSAAALSGPRDQRPATLDNVVAEFVRDDTQLIGEPLKINGQGDTVVPLGAAPENATELAVAVRCAEPGSFEFHIDRKYAMTVTCDGASGGSGSYFTVEDMAAHTLAVAAGEGERFMIWASWVARPVPPAPSPQQAAATADGEVTEAEYRAQFDRYSDCMTAAGYPLDGVNKAGPIITYINSGASVSSGAEGRCYAEEFAQIDGMWQATHQPGS